jgi:hypothetical protein
MTVELDHLFVCVSAGGPEAERLAELGLTEGPPNRHSGQGTACRRFFFANAYLELVWVDSPEEVQGEVARPLHLVERWSGRGTQTCPFGVILRPSAPANSTPPFPAWESRPPYLPPPLVLHVGANADRVEEPLLFYLPITRRPDAMPAANRHVLDHPAGVRELTAVRIIGPWPERLSPALQAALQTGAFVLQQNSEFLAELGFDGEKQGRRADLRPSLPLVLSW